MRVAINVTNISAPSTWTATLKTTTIQVATAPVSGGSRSHDFNSSGVAGTKDHQAIIAGTPTAARAGRWRQKQTRRPASEPNSPWLSLRQIPEVERQDAPVHQAACMTASMARLHAGYATRRTTNRTIGDAAARAKPASPTLSQTKMTTSSLTYLELPVGYQQISKSPVKRLPHLGTR